MGIWFADFTAEQANERCRGTMVEHLGIRVTRVGDNFLEGTMPVDARTQQPAGILHGGASVALAESLASLGAARIVDSSRFSAVGMEINANHIRACTEGEVSCLARPLHVGRSTQVWDMKISQDGHLVCAARMTLAIRPKK